MELESDRPHARQNCEAVGARFRKAAGTNFGFVPGRVGRREEGGGDGQRLTSLRR
jgi:hypothetical protein